MAIHNAIAHTYLGQIRTQTCIGGFLCGPLAGGAGQIQPHEQNQAGIHDPLRGQARVAENLRGAGGKLRVERIAQRLGPGAGRAEENNCGREGHGGRGQKMGRRPQSTIKTSDGQFLGAGALDPGGANTRTQRGVNCT